ncbi:MAG: glycosyltransferase family 2 protein [Bacteroidota bacterium]
MILYSFTVPIYNDAYLAVDFCKEFETQFQSYLNKKDINEEVELIFVNDGSIDDSFDTLRILTNKYNFLKVVDLSRNFGQHIALSCGYKLANGKFIGMLNVDQQEPVSEIFVLLNHFKNNDVDIVYGLREFRNSSMRDKVTSHIFNIVLNKLTGNKTPLNIATIRIMNRRFADAYNSLSEKSRYIPGLEAWLGFKQGYVNIIHKERTKGKSSYNFKKRLLMSIDSIISFSDLPLKLIAMFGISIALIGFGLTFYLFISKLCLVNYQPGYTSTVSIITFIGGVQIMVTGLAALYIGRILKEVQNRPLYIIREKINFADDV